MPPPLASLVDRSLHSSNARWQHGVITPINSPREEVQHCSVDAPAHDHYQEAQSRCEVPSIVSSDCLAKSAAQMLPYHQPPPLPFINPRNVVYQVHTNHWSPSQEVIQSQDPSVGTSSTTSIRTSTFVSTSQVHFPNGVVDPRAGTHLSDRGPPKWSGEPMMSYTDYDIRYGSVYSPTFMIGLPCGGTSELCRVYAHSQ